MTTEKAALAAARAAVVTRLISSAVPADAIRVEDRLLAARLVAHSDVPVGILGPNNETTSRISLDRAVSGDFPFYVRVRRDLLALDLDGDDAVTRAHGFYASLRIAGHLPVMIASGQRGRRHLFCKLRPDHRRDVEHYQRLRPVEVRESIRPPFSRHRLGDDPLVRPALLLPSAVDDALDRLRGRPHRPRRALGGLAVSVLKRDTPFVGKSASETIFSLAKGAANARWTVEEFLVLLTSGTFPICAVFAQRCDREGPEDSVTWVRDHLWPDAAHAVAATPPRRPEDNPRGRALIAWAVMEPWPGRTGSTDRAVFLALVHKHLRSGANPVDASIRELCLGAGISSKDTVARALRRLESRGLIERRPVPGRPARGINSEAPPILNSDAYFIPDPPSSEVGQADLVGDAVLDVLGADAFRNRVGYGHRAEQLYALILCIPGIGTKEILDRVGAGRETVLGGLERLAKAELIHRSEERWYSGPRTPDEVVRGTVMEGRGELQKRSFELERRAVREHRSRP